MNITCEVRLEYTASERHAHRWRENAELSITKDDWNHHILALGPKGKKTSFQLEKNIKKIHTSYLKDGKVTITLSTPMVNVFVRNVAEERLRPFVALLQHVQRRPHDDLEEVAEKMGFITKQQDKTVSPDESDDGSGSEAEEVAGEEE